MTQDSQGFKFITVNQDEDDVVIQAGIPVQAEPELNSYENASVEEENNGGNQHCDTHSVDDQVVYENSSNEEEVHESFDYDEEDLLAEEAYNTTPPTSIKRNKWDGYETTAEDLKGSPMPFAQKVTILGGLGLLVLAIGYYFLFM